MTRVAIYDYALGALGDYIRISDQLLTFRTHVEADKWLARPAHIARAGRGELEKRYV